jgi:predicted DNA-binding antitoxin AbrB/MazE fold protein
LTRPTKLTDAWNPISLPVQGAATRVLSDEYQPHPHRLDDRLAPALHAQLAENRVDVELRRVLADAEPLGDQLGEALPERLEVGSRMTPTRRWYHRVMRPIEAVYEDGLLKPEAPLALKQGERVSLLIVRHSDPKRWDLERLAKGGLEEDRNLAEQGLADWAAALAAEDRRRT